MKSNLAVIECDSACNWLPKKFLICLTLFGTITTEKYEKIPTVSRAVSI